MRQSRYVDGDHRFWPYFCYGLVVGAVFGGITELWMYFNASLWPPWILDSPGFRWGFVPAFATSFAYASGRWGERFWHWFFRQFR